LTPGGKRTTWVCDALNEMGEGERTFLDYGESLNNNNLGQGRGKTRGRKVQNPHVKENSHISKKPSVSKKKVTFTVRKNPLISEADSRAAWQETWRLQKRESNAHTPETEQPGADCIYMARISTSQKRCAVRVGPAEDWVRQKGKSVPVFVNRNPGDQRAPIVKPYLL